MKRLALFLPIMTVIFFASLISLVYAQECIDSDNGKDYYNKGHLVYKGNGTTVIDKYGRESIMDGSKDVYDSCERDSPVAIGGPIRSSNYLFENYCDGITSKIEKYECSYGCNDGACVNPSLIQKIISWFKNLFR